MASLATLFPLPFCVLMRNHIQSAFQPRSQACESSKVILHPRKPRRYSVLPFIFHCNKCGSQVLCNSFAFPCTTVLKACGCRMMMITRTQAYVLTVIGFSTWFWCYCRCSLQNDNSQLKLPKHLQIIQSHGKVHSSSMCFM